MLFLMPTDKTIHAPPPKHKSDLSRQVGLASSQNKDEIESYRANNLVDGIQQEVIVWSGASSRSPKDIRDKVCRDMEVTLLHTYYIGTCVQTVVFWIKLKLTSEQCFCDTVWLHALVALFDLQRDLRLGLIFLDIARAIYCSREQDVHVNVVQKKLAAERLGET